MKNIYEYKAEIFKALSNPVRLEIVDILLQGEQCVCCIAQKLGCEQPHISKALNILKKAGIVQHRKEGLNVYYSIALWCIGECISCLNTTLEKQCMCAR